ncbi:hypothetical protein [Gimibacter soli]|uniref:Uncharacterized protein n=1 Tax=Gimibacter soli TaxID=3024400 RepID=A0AAF0BKR4_9PROT|nr:hypothetical protein [Gimibacter soli]WCL53252.1 hypothetical protein PH603_11970 [Gimibacter soli]
MSSQPRISLKSILLLDAATCLLMGLLLVAASGFVSGLTALPPALLFYAGALLLPIGLYMAATATWWLGNAAAVWLVIIGNAGWVVASIILLEMIAPNGLGTAFVVAQALVVAALGWIEFWSLRTVRLSIA